MLSLNNISETFLDYPDSESLAVIVFFNGCSHNCPGCQNKELQIENPNTMLEVPKVYDLIKERCDRNKTDKVVLSGGDPFFNPEEIIKLIDFLQKNKISTCVYTGYTISKIEEFYRKYESQNYMRPSYVKCGVYCENQRDNAMGKHDDKFILASTNQAFYAPILNKDKIEFNRISEGHILYF